MDTNFIANTLKLSYGYYEATRNRPVETGCFWLSSRYYSPELCKFIQPADVSELMLLTSINVGDGNCAHAGEDYYKFINGFDL